MVSTGAETLPLHVAPDARVLVFTYLLSLATGILFGTAPVARRTSEVGLRMALGAKASNVVWLVMRDVVALVTVGLAIGVPAAVALERLVSTMLFGLTNVDAVSIFTAVTGLVAVSGVAAYLPARRASRVDPM